MKKRIVLSLTLAALMGGGVFAQTHFVSAETSILGGGVRYELVATPYLSIGSYVYYNYMPREILFNANPESGLGEAKDDRSHSVFGIGIAGRWYPAGRKFFWELGVGYGSISETYTTYYYNTWGRYEVTETYSGFTIVPGFGWTIDVGGPGGFFVSPGVKFPLTIATEAEVEGYKYPISTNVFLTAIVYFGFGYAF